MITADRPRDVVEKNSPAHALRRLDHLRPQDVPLLFGKPEPKRLEERQGDGVPAWRRAHRIEVAHGREADVGKIAPTS